MENKRGGFGSNFGFIMAAVGSAVGLGNIWGFPYKMGKSGGFTFLILYLVLAVFVGFTIMIAELALGRRTGQGVIGAYRAASKKFVWVGWLAMIAPFLIMSFYSVLGGYCMQYLSLNLSTLAFGFPMDTGSAVFGQMLTNQFGCVLFTALFLLICVLIVRGGIAGGIEKFNKIGMPALFFMLVVVIIRSLTLPGAIDGLKYMFVPGWALANGYMEEAPSFMTVLSTAGGQMFFSLSLAMGAMITYGSYLNKKENITKNAVVIIICDTLVAIMAGMAVIPAAIATYGTDAALSGPKLLFVTLQDVFASMGPIGPLFGAVFFLLVLIAAISSAISLIEVLTTFLIDRRTARGLAPKRSRAVYIITALIAVESLIVALDGLGSNGLVQPMGFCWLDFMDLWAEGIAMPLGAMMMAIMIGWFTKPKNVIEELEASGHTFRGKAFFTFSIKFIVPVVMAFVLVGMLNDFFAWGLFA